MAGSRAALIVASDDYADPGLSRLEAPAHDAAALADVLADPKVGAFDVQVLHNESAQTVRSSIQEFFVESSADDLLLLHFSCHGLKNSDGQLFLAMPDTKPRLLAATGVAASFVSEMMSESPAQRIALFLDCCYGGAFPRGMVVKAGAQVEVRDSFADELSDSDDRGHVVVTASNAMQYSFEAGELKDHDEEPSVFTGALVDGLSSGRADRDGDGWVGIHELFSYVSEKVRKTSAHQRPQMWTFGAQGDFRLARSRVRRVVPTPLEDEFKRIMADPRSPARYGLVAMFRERLVGPDLGVALTAWQNLSILVGDDNSHVADAARDALVRATLRISPSVVELTTDDTGAATGDIELDGPPLLLVTDARTATPWLQLSQPDDRRLRLEATPPEEPGVHAGVVRLSTPIGQHDVPVRVTVPTRVPLEEPGRWRIGRLLDSHALRYGAAGVALMLVVVGAALWLWPDGDGSPRGGSGDSGGSAALPTGPALPTSAVLWVRKPQRGEGAYSITYVAPGEAATTLVESDQALNWPVLLPGRRTVLYGTGSEEGSKSSLRVVGTDGTGDTAFELPKDDCPDPGRPSVNAAGLIALNCFTDDHDRIPGIRVFRTEGTRATLEQKLDDSGLDGSPVWAAGGRYLAFWQAEDDTGDVTHLYAVAADESEEAVPLTSGTYTDSLPAVSPDGRQVVFRRQAPDAGAGDPAQLFVMDIDRADPTHVLSEPRPLDTPGNPNQPGWSIRGQVIYTDDESGTAWAVNAVPGDEDPQGFWPGATDGNAWMLFGADR